MTPNDVTGHIFIMATNIEGLNKHRAISNIFRYSHETNYVRTILEAGNPLVSLLFLSVYQRTTIYV